MKGLINSFQALLLTLSVMQAQAAGLPGQNLWLRGSLVAEACVRGVSEIALQAWVQREAEALKNNSIRRGEFAASSTFELTYH